MSPPGYILTSSADADLRSIIRYTRTQWGEVQTRNYVTALENGIARLAAGQGAINPMDTIYPSLRMAHCEHHYVFCLPRENTPALIIAVLHERMDLMARLAERLG